jgi:hypothetical protein
MRWLSVSPDRRRLTPPRALMTRCQGIVVPAGSDASAYPTRRAWFPRPATRATWPYVATRPLGTRRTTAYTRAYVDAARPSARVRSALESGRLTFAWRKDFHRRIERTATRRERRPAAQHARDGQSRDRDRPHNREAREERHADGKEDAAGSDGADGERDGLSARERPGSDRDDTNAHDLTMRRGPSPRHPRSSLGGVRRYFRGR